MKQYTENQYDDDLTVGTDDYDDSYYTGSVDFFEFSTDEESPISRLKSLILSIDWEITDEILMQFNEELVDLRDIWAGEKINLVYVQALEKISKYIYQKKADSHPSAIKLLLTLYHNLEKIVSSFDLTEEQKKEILLEDVKRFESLKRYIGQPVQAAAETPTAQPKPQKQPENISTEKDLLNLKAIVLGIDWEITDQDLNELRQEVVRLEEKFVESRPKLILLQGIGTLGAYIKLKKSNAHADAFKLLHLFYESLEKIVTTSMTLAGEKAILFPAVEKFNSFKALLGPTIAAESIRRDEKDRDDGDRGTDPITLAPAFADLPEEEIIGFQAEEEAQALGLSSSGNIDNHVESFFTGRGFQKLDNDMDTDGSGVVSEELREVALQGVNVEGDDEEEAEGVLVESDDLAPALSESREEEIEMEPAPAFSEMESFPTEDQVILEDNLGLPAEESAEIAVESAVANEDTTQVGLDFKKLDRDMVLQGVDVETEADDDSDEEALPLMGGELAPALAENDEVSIFNAEIFENSSDSETVDEEIIGTLGGFFDEEIASHVLAGPKVEDEEFSNGGNAIAVDSTSDDRKDGFSSDSMPEFASEQPAVFALEEEENIIEEDSIDTALKDAAIAEETRQLGDEEIESIFPEMEAEAEDEEITSITETEEENLESLFDENEIEQTLEEDVAVDDFGLAVLEEDEDQGEEKITEVDEQLDSFFDLEEEVVESEEDALLFTLPEETITESGLSVSDVVLEEEVVFELAEEEIDLADEGSNVGKTEDIYSDDTVASTKDDVFSSALAVNDTEKETLEPSEDFTQYLETDEVPVAYQSLQTSVDALGIEIDDKVISSLFGEINYLYQNLAEKPLEKTFLQLLSAITRHIDQNRYDSSTDAYALLQSVCRTLTQLKEDNLHQNQEMLLAETHNVLKWQEQILAQQIAKSEAELTIGDSILADPESATEENSSVWGQNESDASSVIDEAQESSNREESSIIHTDDLRQEISTLRQTLQDEIAELRKELQGNFL